MPSTHACHCCVYYIIHSLYRSTFKRPTCCRFTVSVHHSPRHDPCCLYYIILTSAAKQFILLLLWSHHLAWSGRLTVNPDTYLDAPMITPYRHHLPFPTDVILKRV